MSFSEARSVPLLLLLAGFCLSDAADTPAPTTTTATTSQQTPVSISGSTRSDYAPYSTGSSNPTQDTEEPTVKNPVLEIMKYNITLKGFSAEAVVTNITLVQPTVLELSCTFKSNPLPDKATVEVMWKIGNTTVRDDNATKDEHQNIWSTLYMAEIKNKTQLGNYSCVFNTKEKAEGRFSVQVPEIGGKSKSLISYEGDSVVMSCHSGKYVPFDWIWYSINGSEKAVINDTLRPEKYQVSNKLNITKLKVMDLTEKDDGSYWCEAIFLELGESRGKASLKVLTYMAPLKPFLAIAAEVIVLVALIFIYEIYTKKKEPVAEGEKEFEQTEQLKSEDSNGVENSTTRHRKV